MILNHPSPRVAQRQPRDGRTSRIAVIARPHEALVVQEFFELFKTPWEAFDPEQSYDVVVTTGEPPPEFDGRLLVIYGSAATRWDRENELVSGRKPRPGFIRVVGEQLPIYGDVAIFPRASGAMATVAESGETAGLEINHGATRTVRMGYDLFAEAAFLLKQGQPPENALIPTLDLHIHILRRILVMAGVPVIEIPPAPVGTRFISCLTHDIDFLRLRQHKFDRTMWGFCQRATLGALMDFIRGRISLGRLATNWIAVLKLPLVHLGLCDDFWVPFDRYLSIESGKPSTYFLIPFKHRRGTAPAGFSSRGRATRYDVADTQEWIRTLEEKGCEVGVHGIDAWDDDARGREELNRITSFTGTKTVGVRIHWLYFSDKSPRILEIAGFDYDSTCGFNDAIGYRAGTSQAFKPIEAKRLLELPLHIQDTALFFPGRMHLSERAAWAQCLQVVNHARLHGGNVTVLWHDRSLVPERSWGLFYAALLNELNAGTTWFAPAKDVVGWFRKRRAIRFTRSRRFNGKLEIELEHVPKEARQDLVLRVSHADGKGGISQVDTPLAGRDQLILDIPAAAGSGTEIR